MNERDIFIAALDKATAEERSDYVTAACGGDSQLRQRVEALLQTHEQSGEFLQKPLVERLAEGVDDLEEAAETAHEPAWRKSGESLGFLKPSDQPGSLGMLGHYEVQEVIGSGGMGIVLRAFDERLHRVVAIKVMAAPLATNVGARKRFRREARAAAAVCHDNIVTIHAVDESEDLPYLVMQCVAGLSLQQRLDRDGPLALHEILRIGMQTAAGLAAAHAQGLIHRDIKPANILLENGVERVKITDFGLARAAADASVSQTGIAAGTPQYMSPEQARGDALDCRTDLFSLGSVLYAMCTGRAPFRATHSMAVLKRVCEDSPSPIREANSDVPDWLIAAIDKLLAKNPADRYQSAAEVAELLGQRLAQLQHSTPFPLATPKPAPAQPAAPRWPMWAVAALVLLLFGVSMTEATGVTKFAPVLMRIVTGEGTLLVEVNDPAVKVTVEGDGGLIITGAGLHEVHLKPGKYQLKADKNGQRVPLTQELVTITRGNEAVVRVRLEAPVAAVPPAGTGAFVLLGGKEVRERKFETLAEALQFASDGDTIEVQGDGPFVTEPIKTTHALTIRAGEGFRPVVSLSPKGLLDHAPLLVSGSSLVLEGLEFQRLGPVRTQGDPWRFGLKAEKALRIANCRFLMKSTETCLETNTAVCELRNSEFLCPGWTSSFNSNDLQPGQRLVVENCLFTAGCELVYLHRLPKPVHVRLARNTFRVAPLWFYLQRENLDDVARDGNVMQVEASDNLFDGGFVVRFEQYQRSRILPVAEAEKTLVELVHWKGERNLFASGEPLVRLVEQTGDQKPANPVRTLEAWRAFWGTQEVDSVEGRVKYHGGDLLARSESAPEQLTPQDWRLRSDSAGYRAGKDGKDLGADVDLVGPGEAYERWKKLPDYQTWLKDTGQLRAETPKPETGAFVRLGGKGVAEQKFDTLAEAAASASDGDTIEVRGNGPFVTDPIDFGTKAFVVRAGSGFAPLIKSSAAGRRSDAALLSTHAPLTLEGLLLQNQGPRESCPTRLLIATSGAPLFLANCNLAISPGMDGHPIAIQASRVQARNCQIVSWWCAFLLYWPRMECTVDNCLIVGNVALYPGDLTDSPLGTVRLTRNTTIGSPTVVEVGGPTDPLAARLRDSNAKPVVPVLLTAEGNVCQTSQILYLNSVTQKSPQGLPVEEQRQFLAKIIRWQEHGNIYGLGEGPFLGLHAPHTGLLKDLAEWNKFWNLKDTGSVQQKVRLRGNPTLITGTEAITPGDFRLRADSAGYRAGKDGKDLGADVDLVGPGAAYERWKKTPEYQTWLKDTGQVRAEAPKPETGAFVLQGGKGVAERKFDNLAEAVESASDGDTIEVRGNGPFVSDAVTTRHPLVIRAGAGFTPLITLSKASADRNFPLVTALDALVLEGLELQRMGGAASMVEERSPLLLSALQRGSLHVANCRLIYRGDSPLWEQGALLGSYAGSLSVRNSVLSGNIGDEAGGFCESGRRYDIENCVCAVGGIGFSPLDPNVRDASIRVRRNTLVGNCLNLTLFSKPNLPGAGNATPPIHLEFSGNVACWDATTRNKGFLFFHQAQKEPFSAAQAEAILPRLVRLDEKQNVYRTGTPMLQFVANWQSIGSNRGQDLADWDRFWGQQNTGSVEGVIRLQGGDLVTRARSAPELVTAEDFRLRADSAGYRAGPDGKDLGADIDLVGPGEAYERWKKTPEYQEWLKETKQVSGQ